MLCLGDGLYLNEKLIIQVDSNITITMASGIVLYLNRNSDKGKFVDYLNEIEEA